LRIAVLGTGTMGTGMVRTLLRNSHDVTVWNRHEERAKPLAADGARVESSSAAAVVNADVVLTMLFDEPAVTAIATEFLASMTDGAIWMQCSTVGPAGIRRLEQLAKAHGVGMVDAPVVGTKKPAEDGMLVVLVSGDSDRIDRLDPVLDAIASKIVRVGVEIGAASGLKLACNAWVASLTVATAQSLAMCEAFGLDPKLFLSTIGGGPSDTPYAQLKGDLMIDADYTASFAVDGVLKDLALMIDAVDHTDVSVRLLLPLYEAFAAASSSGHDKDDIAAVITSFR
jgi:3-hydroxyisobutyrate dehydrogenase